MTTPSRGSAELRELVRAHGADLHRLAAMLTGAEVLATSLTARTLAHHDPVSPVSPDRVKTDLVRNYLRSAPRRQEGVRATDGDAGDVLRHLRPRARAAAALQLVEGWDAEPTARAVGVSRSKVATLVPSVPGLDFALVAVADQHALAGQELEEAVLGATPDSGLAPTRWRGRGPLIAAVLAVALAVGLVQAEDRGDEGGQGAGAEHPETLTTTGHTDLTEAGWLLDEDGDPPRSVNGVHLRETVTLDKGRRDTLVSLPTAPEFAFAAFGVLWCDMPPTEDDHLKVPAGTLRVDGVEITLPCAGREGSPPVTQVVALPPSGQGMLELSGDMPGDGVATLGVYQETESHLIPMPRGDLTEGPPVDDGAVELDLSEGGPGMHHNWRAVQSFSVGHGSTIRVWAGRTGGIAVNVDGVPATDDGDVAAVMALLEAQLEEPSDAAQVMMPEPRDYADWSTQQADVRDGRWLVPAPDAVRTFTLPSQLTPGAGERRTVTVEVVTENVDDHLQVVVTDALPAAVDTAPVVALATPDAPLFVTGHRMVGQWEVPADGHVRELTLDDSGPLPEETVILAVREPDPTGWSSWGEGRLSRGGEAVPFWPQRALAGALLELRRPEFAQLPPGPGPLTVAVPAAVGHPATSILAYTPVPYEEFDFSAAVVPADIWPAGSPPTDPHSQSHMVGYETVTTIGPQDLQDGQVTVSVEPGGEVAVQATTEGKGRIRFLVDGQPADGLWASDGWWSSWTVQPVTSVVSVAHFLTPRSTIELTVVVEDYEDFSLQVQTGDPSWLSP
ncbi:hypothetical protein [Ornithinimicrobium pratense]|uniref:Uncharacterized protein n=1 Tax=Ornithinimicrobium pratense TaxID=2593973 RepID=A0A5J6V878_9MICO|nr:hypothetical protein [Ornithinimicrobium pratense]QFG69988.1 hypothetical protein FY030_15870 [Ornithinimicrobium pratense]